MQVSSSSCFPHTGVGYLWRTKIYYLQVEKAKGNDTFSMQILLCKSKRLIYSALRSSKYIFVTLLFTYYCLWAFLFLSYLVLKGGGWEAIHCLIRKLFYILYIYIFDEVWDYFVEIFAWIVQFIHCLLT